VITLSDYQNKYRYFKMDRTSDGILKITFHTNGGPVMWGVEVVEALGFMWADVANDRENKIIIVTGTGSEFIATMSVATGSMSADLWDGIASNVRRMYRGLLGIEVPMIAAVNGPALLHSEQALLCDIVIASSTAEFQDSPHFAGGLVPGDGTQVIFTHLLGANRARYLLYMNQKLSAQRALELGLVSEVHPPEQLQARAMEIARQILKQSDIVRRYTRQVTIEPIRQLYSRYLEHGLAVEGLGAWAGWTLS
jgi:enoyl-CoA hydratase/carnithine racemase